MKRIFLSKSWADLKEKVVASVFLSVFESCFRLPVHFVDFGRLFPERKELVSGSTRGGGFTLREVVAGAG